MKLLNNYKIIEARRKTHVLVLAFTLGLLTLILPACDKNEDLTNPASSNATTVKASEWISKADWTTVQKIDFRFTENPYGITTNAPLVLNAGQPYILRLINPVGNKEKHYFAVDQANNFFKAIATRKAQTPDAEYKAPYFEAFELLVPTTSERVLELYFVPVKAGKYQILCSLPGHKEGGMHVNIEIKGDPALRLDLEVDPAFKADLSKDARKSGSHAIWSSMINKTVTINETPAYSFSPGSLDLKQNQAYKIRLEQQSGNTKEHYYTAEAFFKTVVTRKLQDSHAEIKPYYLKAVELLKGNTFADMYVVPTVADTYPVVCTIQGHEHAGMKGSVKVTTP